MSWRMLPAPLGRILVCTRCSDPVDVLEAAQGARTDDEHRFLNPDEYVCSECLDTAGASVDELARELADA